MRINNFFLFPVIISLTSYLCNSAENNSCESNFTREDIDIWSNYAALPAPNDVYSDIDTLFSDSLRSILHSIPTERHIVVMISVRDSVIVDSWVFCKELEENIISQIELSFINHRPVYCFIDSSGYMYGDYSFVIDKSAIRKP